MVYLDVSIARDYDDSTRKTSHVFNSCTWLRNLALAPDSTSQKPSWFVFVVGFGVRFVVQGQSRAATKFISMVQFYFTNRHISLQVLLIPISDQGWECSTGFEWKRNIVSVLQQKLDWRPWHTCTAGWFIIQSKVFFK